MGVIIFYIVVIKMKNECVSGQSYYSEICRASDIGGKPTKKILSFGYIPSKNPLKPAQALPGQLNQNLPKQFNSSQQWLNSILVQSLNQGACNDCFVISPTSVLGDRVGVELTKKGYKVLKPIQASALVPLTCLCNFPDTTENFTQECGGPSGGTLEMTCEWLKSNATTVEKCYPYPTLTDSQPPGQACLNLEKTNGCICDKNNSLGNIKLKVQAYTPLDTKNVLLLKNAIYTQGSVAIGLLNVATLKDFWQQVQSNPTSVYSDDGSAEKNPGGLPSGHALVLIGWDDTKGAWLVRNSWGPSPSTFYMAYTRPIYEAMSVTPDINDSLIQALQQNGYISQSPGSKVTPTDNTPTDNTPTDNTPTDSTVAHPLELAMGVGAIVLLAGVFTVWFLHSKKKGKRRRR